MARDPRIVELHTLPDGSRFQSPDGRLRGTLLYANYCRARVRYDKDCVDLAHDYPIDVAACFDVILLPSLTPAPKEVAPVHASVAHPAHPTLVDVASRFATLVNQNGPIATAVGPRELTTETFWASLSKFEAAANILRVHIELLPVQGKVFHFYLRGT